MMKTDSSVSRVIRDIDLHPDQWFWGRGNYTIVNALGLEVWTISGFGFYQFWNPKGSHFCFFDQLRFHFCFKRWKRHIKKKTDSQIDISGFLSTNPEVEELNRIWNLSK